MEQRVFEHKCFNPVEYPDANFFGVIDTNNGVYKTNPKLNDQLELIKSDVQKLLIRLSFKASGGLLYAQGTRALDKNNIYASIECPWDLSSIYCKKCLEVGISELLDRSYKMRGGRTIYGSCVEERKIPTKST